MSCGQIALERAGIQVDKYFSSEIDKYAIEVTQRNYPNTIQLGDITKLQGSDLPKIDLLMGGSPCQGFSFAGQGLNFDDPRSKLFFEFVRLKNETNPTYFLLENVKMRTEYRNVISRYLEVNPIEINSSLLSAQNRKRLYWTNIKDIEQPNDKGIVIKDILDDDTEPIILHNLYGGFKEIKPRVFVGKSPTIRTAGGGGHIPSVLKLGNIYPSGGQNGNIYDTNGKSPSIMAGVGIKGRGIGSSNAPKIFVDNEPEKVKRWTTDNYIQYDLGGKEHKSQDQRAYYLMGKHGTIPSSITETKVKVLLENGDIRKLSPIECERLQTIPDNYTEGVSDTQRYKMIGNGWTVDVIAHILRYIYSSKRCSQEVMELGL
jgi:DNA-cytosine methyltransferase